MNFKSKSMLLFLILIFITVSSLSAHEWSDEVRMTYAGENWIDGTTCELAIDSSNNLHLIYTYNDCQFEGYERFQAVYQTFRRFGESLSQPILLADIADCPDTSSKGFDILIDDHNNKYLLWGHRTLHVTILDDNGNPVISDIVLQGMIVSTSLHHPRLAIDSSGNIIVIAVVYDPSRQGDERQYELAYGRFTKEGELIDTLVFLQDNSIFEDLYVEISGEDTLHFTWWDLTSEGREIGVHYSKVSPENEFMVDNMTIPYNEQDEYMTLCSFSLDKDGLPVYLSYHATGCYLKKFDYNMEPIFNRYIARDSRQGERGDIFIDDNNIVHIVYAFLDEEYNEDDPFIGYCSINENGDLIDTLQVIHDKWMRGEYRWAYFHAPRIVVTTQGNVCVCWEDNRYSDEPLGPELQFRYSDPETTFVRPEISYPTFEFTILPSYPNPFNSFTHIPFRAQTIGLYEINISSLDGRIISSGNMEVISPGIYTYAWNGSNFINQVVASGLYLVSIQHRKQRQHSKILMIR